MTHPAETAATRNRVRARTTLGDFELTVLTDGTYYLDGGAMFGVVPKPLWQKRAPADDQNRILLGTNTVVVRTGQHTVAIETGIGNKLPEKLRAIYDAKAQLPESFDEAGIRLEEVDVVINSHLHFDHCGWNTVRRGSTVVPTFPGAKYYAPEGEWQYAQKPSERDAISYISANYDPLVSTGQMQLLEGDQEIVPGISVAVFPGHTRHMQAVILHSEGKTACYISDLIPTTWHLDLTWGMSFDLFPLETIANKKRYYAQAIPKKWLTLFTHDPNMPWAYVEKDEKEKMVARGAQ
jgi:glyoxylase-like metal-dependent hydrolase (beta-lactamase superfamily II)